jgi:hypothetical protein
VGAARERRHRRRGPDHDRGATPRLRILMRPFSNPTTMTRFLRPTRPSSCSSPPRRRPRRSNGSMRRAPRPTSRASVPSTSGPIPPSTATRRGRRDRSTGSSASTT